jgi:tetratricopeptide (TPR) repeat protein
MSLESFEEYAELQRVGTEAEAGRLKEGFRYALGRLSKNPMDVSGLILGSYCMRRLGEPVMAYHFALAGLREDPTQDALWLNMGAAAQELWLIQEAENAYQQALRYAQNDKHRAVVHLNLSALYADNGQFERCEEFCRKVLASIPDHRNARANLSFCQLARRDWVAGWEGQKNTIGGDWKPLVQYNGEPQWDGTPGKTVVLYEDQGVGDGISFASVLPDAIRDCRKVILDCEPKLAKLFRRSFPQVKVYATRRETGVNGTQWDKEDRSFDASYPLSQIPEFYRKNDSDFPGTPYLTPCPVRTQMWRDRFAAVGKPVIGIAWTGGVPRTNARFRQLTLESLTSLLTSIDAHWVCLQYKDADKEIAEFREKHPDVDIVQYRWATLTNDYDDTAALVAALDCLICMQTAVAHLGGALGVPTTVLIPTATTWRYGASGDTIPWYHSMRLVRQSVHGHWEHEIERIAADLRKLSHTTAGVARQGQLRGDGRASRANGQCDH